jgi:Protein of unknown function (DUF2946)
MDELVKQAMRKWPHVPDCYGWLGLDNRGQWRMRDEQVQKQGHFQTDQIAAKGAVILHDKLIEFISRNYTVDSRACWYFQNGPQKVYVELQSTPYIWRLNDNWQATAHTGHQTEVQTCWVDENGCVYLQTELGFGLLHSWDVGLAAEAIAKQRWAVKDCMSENLPQQFGYEMSPACVGKNPIPN